MITKFNHVAIVVPDLNAAKKKYKEVLGANVSEICDYAEHGVSDIKKAVDKLKKNGVRILGDETPKIGAHDKPVIFLHPKDFYGTLIELEQE